MKNYLVRVKEGNKLFTESEIIENALHQEADGIRPHYCFYDYGKREKVTAPGWLVWSSYESGCGVCYRRNDGKMVIVTGFPGDFLYC